MSEQVLIERELGGEAGRRGLMGAGARRARTRGFIIAFAVFAVVGIFISATVGVVLACLIAGVTVVLTLKTGAGVNGWTRVQNRRRTRERATTGRDVFRPVRDRPEGLETKAVDGSRKEKRAAIREWNNYRDVHDAAEGLTWLQAVPNRAGIAWQVAAGETPALTVVFPLGGQIRGLESDRRISSVATKFGRMLAANGELSSRVSRVQLVTRLLPVDTAAHEAWVLENLNRGEDGKVREDLYELMVSYAQVVDQLKEGNGGLGQRHFCVAKWPVTPKLLAAGARRGDGVEGLVRLMNNEIDQMYRRLAGADLDPGRALTAAQVAAMCRHQQMPTYPIDQAGDLNAYDPDPWLTEDGSAMDHSIVTDTGPEGERESWWHATARVPIEAVETGARSPLWMLPLLSRMAEPVIRTIALEFETVPATQARAQARQDLTLDMANLAGQAKKGQIAGAELEVAQAAAKSRVNDLRPGSGHHGGVWVMHVTVSAADRTGLIEAMERIEEAAGHTGITELAWIEGVGVAHHGYTFPLARAMASPKESTLERTRALVGGKGRKDALR